MAIQILGLDNCADIIAGDAMRTGISGGQKRRLTTGWVNRHLFFFFWLPAMRIIFLITERKRYTRDLGNKKITKGKIYV